MDMHQPRTARERAIGAGLKLLGASFLPRLAAPMTRGIGAILMFHHVRPWGGTGFAPNKGLEITPEFLDDAIKLVRMRGFDILGIDEAIDRLTRGSAGRPFVVLTFDDGYRDNLVHALPVLRWHKAPFTLYVTTGFAEGTARLWWIELEAAIRKFAQLEIGLGAPAKVVLARRDLDKLLLFKQIYWYLRSGSEEKLLDVIGELADRAGIDRQGLTKSLCMDWNEIGEFAREPLCTIGVHTLTHPMLAKHPVELARQELSESRTIIETKIGRPATHLAWPVGDPTSAGPRDFALARELGFASAVTTRKGMIFPEHAAHLTALPRLSVNGGFQSRAMLDVLLTGLPFWLGNRGRRVNVG